MKLCLVALGVSLLGVACSATEPSTSESEAHLSAPMSVTGTVHGATLNAMYGRAEYRRLLHNVVDGVSTYVLGMEVTVSNKPVPCDLERPRADALYFDFSILATTESAATPLGTFPLATFSEKAGDTEASFNITDDRCQNSWSVEASSGTITIDREDAARVTGRVDVAFAGGEGSVSGSFDVVMCPSIVDAVDEPPQTAPVCF